MSLHFQRNDLVLPSTLAILKETTASIKRLPKRPVPGGKMEAVLESFKKHQDNPPQFQGIILKKPTGRRALSDLSADLVQKNLEQLVELCLKAMEERFGPLLQIKKSVTSVNVNQIISDFLVFNHDAWPSNMQDLVHFGQDKIDRLVNCFQAPLTLSGCISSVILMQWLSMKVLVHSQFMDKSYNDLWAMLLTKAPYYYKDDLRDILFLIEILLVLPLSAAQCKRTISAQNRIKNSHRASLASQTTKDLIRISAEGPSLNELDPAPAVAAWFACAKKPRRPFCHS